MSFIGKKIMQKVAADNTVHDDLSTDFVITETMVNILNYEAKDDKELLDYALEKAIEITESKIGYIYHYSEKDKLFTLNSWSKEVMKICTIQEKQRVYELDKTGIWGEVVRQRKPIMLNDYTAPHPLKKGYPPGHAELHKFLSIPVFEKDQIVMVVGVGNKEIDYTLDDIKKLRVFMIAVKSILQKFDLLKKLQDSQEQLSKQLASIEEVNKLMVGREIKMVEMKKQIQELEMKLGK